MIIMRVNDMGKKVYTILVILAFISGLIGGVGSIIIPFSKYDCALIDSLAF